MTAAEQGSAMTGPDDSRPWIAHYPVGVPASIEPVPAWNAYEMLGAAARRHPGRPAIAWFGRHISYRRLERECERFAGVLAGLGVGKGDRVALILPNCPQYVIAYYASLRLGAVVVGNNPLYTERELTHQLRDARPTVVVVLDALYPATVAALRVVDVSEIIVTRITDYMGFPKKQLAPIKLRKEARRAQKPWPPVPPDAPVQWWKAAMRQAGTPPPLAEVDPDVDLAALVYTGGTTGLSKGAMLSHRNLVANARQCDSWFVGTEDGREAVMCVLPFFHCYGMTVGMNLGLIKAAKLVLLPRFKVAEVMKAMEKERPSLFPGVPRIYVTINQAAENNDADLSSIKYCLSGAGALPLAVAERFEELTGGRLVEGYGLTEASPVAIGNPMDGTARPGTIGLPLPDTHCRIVDLADPSRILSPGGEGELWIGGPQVMKGYWNRREETEAVLQGGWLRTGDVAVMDDDGFFRIVDRIKEMIKVSGYNVYPTEVEEVLHRHPKVLRACVVGVPDGEGGEMVKAFIVLRNGEAATPQEFLEWCRDPKTGMASYRIPRAVEFRPSLPETIVGKVLRRVLADEERQKTSASESPAPT
jgi:long-chain acyl-CoA synthetase